MKPYDKNVHYVLFDPDDSKPDYIGTNTVNSADTATTTWEIYKLEYVTGTTGAAKIRVASGAWSNRAALFP